jgi:hypothetical protein
LVSGWSDALVQVPSRTVAVESWWNLAVCRRPKEEARLPAALLIYTSWNLWKEVSQPPARILALIKDEVQVSDWHVEKLGFCLLLNVILALLK